ncbi:MAG: hypothetical protein LWX07_04240 [Bacteroidetes bacterium]|nr:hypothetical protein [Bacteroidota bacterium]
MRTVRLAAITAFLLMLPLISRAQINNSPVKLTEKRSHWAIGLMYTDNGFGLSGTYFKNIGRTTDLTLKLSVSGVTDPSEVEYYDIYGNSYIAGKVNRVYLTTLSIGLKKNIFYDDIEGNFKPFIRAGVAPSFVITTPFDRSFFKAFGYAQPGFAIGPYGGIGIEYQESNSVGMSITAD